MAVYSKVVSTVKQIDTIHTFIGGTRTDIVSGWTFVNGERKQVFPSSEYYTEVAAHTSAGSYSDTLSYGKYKIVFSGGGGSGAALAFWSYTYTSNASATAGTAAEEKTIYIEVPYGSTKTISGIVGQAGQRSYARGSNTHHDGFAGAGGTGYASGTSGQQKQDLGADGWVSVSGGAGGGSTSVLIDSELQDVAKGGNGGAGSIKYREAGMGSLDKKTLSSSGGTGGSGGTNSGTGASGGVSGIKKDGEVYSSAGQDGYVYIYQSSIYPN